MEFLKGCASNQASFGLLLVQLDVSIVTVALARIGIKLRADVAGLQWVVDSYTLLFASLLLLAGAFGIRPPRQAPPDRTEKPLPSDETLQERRGVLQERLVNDPGPQKTR